MGNMFDRLRNMSAGSPARPAALLRDEAAGRANILARHGLSEQKFSHMNHRASCGARSFPIVFLEKAEGSEHV